MKDVGRLDLDAIERLPGTRKTLDDFRHVRGWLDDASRYKLVPRRGLDELPMTRLAPADSQRLLDFGVVRPIDPREACGGVRVFRTPEPAKLRWRPIKWTRDVNDTLDASTLMPLTFSSPRKTSPAVGGNTPVSKLMNVVLPAPFGPMMA